MTSLALYQLASGLCTGRFNMSCDADLLDQVCDCPVPVLIIRTYQWKEPTLTLGVHQPEKDLPDLISRYQSQLNDLSTQVVRRPTGGRAILHDQDISFSFTTNYPELIRLSLKDSYRLLSGFVSDTLSRLSVPLEQAVENAHYQAEAPSANQYAHSAVCFETRTPSDLLTQNGQKISGSAQLRKAGGILQQGTSFLETCAPDLSYERFHQTLVEVVGAHFEQPVRLFSESMLNQPEPEQCTEPCLVKR